MVSACRTVLSLCATITTVLPPEPLLGLLSTAVLLVLLLQLS
jgi:hypothetical protein